MNSIPFARLFGGLTAVSAFAMMTATGMAQDQAEMADGGIVLEGIIVSGEKVERSIDETASSVAVVTSDDIEKSPENHSVTDAIKDIPNVNYAGTVGQAPVIRGQDTQGPTTGGYAFWGGTVPRATINVDGHYLGYNEFVYGSTAIWDVESIEVFRGPQTTSQGANAIAGAIIVKTKDPTFTPEGAAQVEYNSLNGKRTSLAVSGPLSDELAGRIALDYYARDTYIDYTNPNFITGDTEQDFEAINARVKLLWRPTALPGFEAKLTYSNTHNKLRRMKMFMCLMTI